MVVAAPTEGALAVAGAASASCNDKLMAAAAPTIVARMRANRRDRRLVFRFVFIPAGSLLVRVDPMARSRRPVLPSRPKLPISLGPMFPCILINKSLPVPILGIGGFAGARNEGRMSPSERASHLHGPGTPSNPEDGVGMEAVSPFAPEYNHRHGIAVESVKP